MRRLYDWVLHWAATPYAVPALFVLSFAESSFFPIPPDVLLIALCIGNVRGSYRYAFWCSLASVLGGIAGYGIGMFAWDQLRDVFYAWVPGVNEASVAKVSALYEQHNFWIVFVAAFTPIPYKVFTIAGGVFAISFPMFVIASLIGRAGRFFLVAALLWKFGPPMKSFIDRYFNLLSFVFVVLLIGGFALIKLLK